MFVFAWRKRGKTFEHSSVLACLHIDEEIDDHNQHICRVAFSVGDHFLLHESIYISRTFFGHNELGKGYYPYISPKPSLLS